MTASPTGVLTSHNPADPTGFITLAEVVHDKPMIVERKTVVLADRDGTKNGVPRRDLLLGWGSAVMTLA